VLRQKTFLTYRVFGAVQDVLVQKGVAAWLRVLPDVAPKLLDMDMILYNFWRKAVSSIDAAEK